MWIHAEDQGPNNHIAFFGGKEQTVVIIYSWENVTNIYLIMQSPYTSLGPGNIYYPQYKK